MNIKVIVIDDEIGIIEALKENLDADIVGYTSSVEGIEKIKQEKFDLLVLDFYIDEMNGSQVIEKIRKFDNDIYIMLLTGYKDDIPALKALEDLDIQGYCEKSSRLEDIIVVIKSMMKSIEHAKVKRDTFASRLKELRRVHNLSQPDVAKVVGVGRTAVANWEAGLTWPSAEGMLKLAEFFNVTTDFLYCHEVKYSF